MKRYDLKIAGYKLRLESGSDGPDLFPSERFSGYICTDGKPDVTINVHSGTFLLPAGTEKVLKAPFFQESDGIRIKKGDDFWSVYKNGSDLFIKTIFPLSPETKQAVLKFSQEDAIWDLYIDSSGDKTDPLDYPLDGLVLYYLTVIHRDIMIHASGVSYRSKGYLFSGVSGKGKTTMAKLWNSRGARVIHDDRIIVRMNSGKCFMYNTPVYKNEFPCEAMLTHIFLIEHGSDNKILRVAGAQAVAGLMANCIQHNWSSGIIEQLIDSLSGICSATRVYRLSFKPDSSVIDNIINEE